MQKKGENEKIPSSFRDPSGFVYLRDNVLLRQVNNSYRDEYDFLIKSGLYDALSRDELMVHHAEMPLQYALNNNAYKIIQPRLISFISYPYEWCFSQLKNAAIATLSILKIALDHEMILKDASAFNIQFIGHKPIFIDTLSFERYHEGEPWVAYRQFCQHFLAPLALMCHKDVRLGQLFRSHIDGIPLDLAAKVLPFRSKLNPLLYTHIFLHAKYQKNNTSPASKTLKKKKISRFALRAIIDSLQSAVNKMTLKAEKTEWSNYYEDTNYSEKAMEHKADITRRYLSSVQPKYVWDLGANTGRFSKIAADLGALTISFDIDLAAVEKNYCECVRTKSSRILPLHLDLTNPSPAAGWDNAERSSLFDRGPTELVLALALLHHLVISHNLPLEKTAVFFSKLCNYLIIEFIPKDDSQAQRLLASRKDIFHNYTQREFEDSYSLFFNILSCEPIANSNRTIYLMKRK